MKHQYDIITRPVRYSSNSLKKFSECWDISKGKLVYEFQNWGDEYLVEFYITVTHLPTSSWTNVFRFTTLPGIYGSDGDSIPSLFISNDGKFMFHSSVNNNFNHGLDIDFELNTMYNVSIGQQIDEDGKYWYEILIDGDSKLKIENKNHRSYTNVKLYASDSFFDPLITNIGSICNVNIQHQDKGLFALFYAQSSLKYLCSKVFS